MIVLYRSISSSLSTIVLSLTIVYSWDRRANGSASLFVVLGNWFLRRSVAANVSQGMASGEMSSSAGSSST